MKNAYTLTIIYNECSSGQNWIESFTTLDKAVFELSEHLHENGEDITQGRYTEDEDWTDSHLYFDRDGDLILNTDLPRQYIGKSWDCGDYRIILEKI